MLQLCYGRQTDGGTGFLRAARAGNLDKVLEYLSNSIDIDVCNAVSFKRNIKLAYANTMLCVEYAYLMRWGLFIQGHNETGI